MAIWIAFVRGDGDYPDWYTVFGTKGDATFFSETVRGLKRKGKIERFEDDQLFGYPGDITFLEADEYVLVKAFSIFFGA